MALKSMKKICLKTAEWLVALAVLYYTCVFLGVEGILPSRRVLVKTSRTDLTVLSLASDLVCLMVSCVFLYNHLGGLEMNLTGVLKTGACLVAFMSSAVFLLCQGALEHFVCSCLKMNIDPIHPLVLKVAFFCLIVSMYLSFSQLALLKGKQNALGIIASLVTMWTVAVSFMTWSFLNLGLDKYFSKVDTVVDERMVNYVPLLVVSVLLFLVVDSVRKKLRSRNTA